MCLSTLLVRSAPTTSKCSSSIRRMSTSISRFPNTTRRSSQHIRSMFRRRRMARRRQQIGRSLLFFMCAFTLRHLHRYVNTKVILNSASSNVFIAFRTTSAHLCRHLTIFRKAVQGVEVLLSRAALQAPRARPLSLLQAPNASVATLILVSKVGSQWDY